MKHMLDLGSQVVNFHDVNIFNDLFNCHYLSVEDSFILLTNT